MSSVELSAGNAIELLHCGAEFFPALIKSIDEAATEIYLETYIFATDDAGLAVLDSLTSAAARGVTVNLITDWVGTGRAGCGLLSEALRHTTVNYRVFNKWFHRGVARTHRKICVVDKKLAFVGGININHDLYSAEGPESLPSPRWDFSVKVRGPIVDVMHREAVGQWLRTGPLPLLDRLQLFTELPSSTSAPVHSDSLAGFFTSDNLHNRFTIQSEYLRAINGSSHCVLLANPYFAPGRTFRDALSSAADRGVRVMLLLGVGQFPIQDWVARSYYRKLLKSGVRLFEYRRSQLHAKVAVIDDQWATVGSSNCDGLSVFVNHEANLVVHDRALAINLGSQIRRGMLDAIEIEAKDFVRTPWFKRLWYGLSFLVYRGVMRVITLNNYA